MDVFDVFAEGKRVVQGIWHFLEGFEESIDVADQIKLLHMYLVELDFHFFLLAVGVIDAVGDMAEMAIGINIASRCLSLQAVLQVQIGLGRLYSVAVLVEEDWILTTGEFTLIIVKECLVLEQIIDLGEQSEEKVSINAGDESFDELRTGLLEDVVAVVLHLLVDLVDGVGVQLVQLAELPEAALDDEAKPQ
jgi:hypothetical protein